MGKFVFAICLALLFAGAVQAQQGKVDSHWNCGKATDEHSIDVGDQPGHAYAVSQSKCSAVKGEMGGVQEKEGTGTEFHDVIGNKISWHGVFIETLSSGDKVQYSYKGTGTASGDKFVSGNNTWAIFGGTGKFKGAKGAGSCAGKGNPDGTVTWDCEGSYSTAAAAPANKKM